jgi:hypothetical protein
VERSTFNLRIFRWGLGIAIQPKASGSLLAETCWDSGLHGERFVQKALILSRASEEITDAADSVGSEQFNERWIKNSTGKVVGMDALGTHETARVLAHNTFPGGDIANYRLQSEKHRNALDQIIDSACFAKR